MGREVLLICDDLGGVTQDLAELLNVCVLEGSEGWVTLDSRSAEESCLSEEF